jgi:Flp pilus assembly protein TadG
MRSLAGPLQKRLRIYGRDEDGSMVVFTLFILAMMLMVGGLAVDMMRFENYRARLQATLDRAVLAAADLDICLDAGTNPVDVVNDYVTKAGFDQQVDAVVVNSGTGSCTVTAQATIEVNTIFMQAVGVDQLSTPTAAVATERATGLEVALVLDTSGSMGREGRIEALRPAASEFVDAIFSDYDAGTVSMSMVPYSSNVNLGPDLKAEFNVNFEHDYSHCLELVPGDYNAAGLNPDRTYQQTVHVDPYHYSSMSPWWDADRFLCDVRPENHVVAWSDNALDLTTAIGNLQPHENTSIDMGAVWGLSMLSPSFRPILSGMIGGGHVDSSLSGQPRDFGDPDIQKVLVLMTDGMNTYYHEFKPNFPRGISDIHYDVVNDAYYIQDREQGDEDGDGINAEEFYDPQNGVFVDTIDFDGDGTEDFPALDWNEVYDNISFDDQAWFFRAKEMAGADYEAWYNDLFEYGTTAVKDDRLDSACTAAKNEGVIIFTIGMMVPAHSVPILESCASSPAHFYHVADLDVASAFRNIAQSLSELQLVQ